MEKIECPVCRQISENPFCPYCGMKLQPTEEEQKLLEKQRKLEEKREKKKRQENEKMREALAEAAHATLHLRETREVEKPLINTQEQMRFRHKYGQKQRPKRYRYSKHIGFLVGQAIVILIWGFLTDWTFFMVSPPMPVVHPNNANEEILNLFLITAIIMVIVIIAVLFLLKSNVPKRSEYWRRR